MSIWSRLKSKKAEEKKEKKEVIKEASAVSSRAARKARGNLMSLVKQAWITERAGDLTKEGKYIFIVDARAAKPEIKKAIELIYNTKVADVNVMNVKGKTKRLGRNIGRTSETRKAIVTLKKGYKIDVMST